MEQAAVASCFDRIGNATVIMLSRIEFTRLLGAIKGDTIVNCDAVFGAGIATVHHGYVYYGFSSERSEHDVRILAHTQIHTHMFGFAKLNMRQLSQEGH